MQDIHDIRAPLSVGVDPMLYKTGIFIFTGIVLLLIVLILIRRWFKNRSGKESAMPVSPGLPPFETALKLLGRLEEKKAPDPRQTYFSLTLIFRQFIGQTYGMPGAQMTSQEFSTNLKMLDFPMDVKTAFLRFQDKCDPIKYAGGKPEENQIRTDICQVRHLIEQVEAHRLEQIQTSRAATAGSKAGG